jgi:hypothetical protein
LYETIYNRTTCTGYVRLAKTELALQTAVANIGPVTVNVDSSLESFKNYASGIYDDAACSSNYMDHSVSITFVGE